VIQLIIFIALALLMLCALQARAEDALSAPLVMQRGEERFRSIRDYECQVDVESRLGKRVEAGTCQFWFKQPRMLRVKVLRGSRSGSQVAIDSAGQIRGSKGGILGLIVRRIKSTDPRLLSIRGTSMMTLDWGSFFLKYHAAVLRPDAQVTLAPHPDASSPYEVMVAYPHLGKSVREVYSLDPQQWLIVEGAVYEDNTRVEHVDFRSIKLNTGKPDAWFRL
jgi:outer membrane lipoprotein-sorting protein